MKTFKDLNMSQVINYQPIVIGDKVRGYQSSGATNKKGCVVVSYTKEDVLRAGEIGEVSMIDVRHIVSLLDEAKEINQKNLKNF